MVLYVESLIANIKGYVLTAKALKDEMDEQNIEYLGFAESMEICRLNCMACEKLLKAGIREIEVPEKKS